MAKKVQAHLYDVIKEENELTFSKFDKQAFDCVIALEGLNEQDYFFVDTELSSALFSGFTQLNICIEIVIQSSQSNSSMSGHFYNHLVCNYFQCLGGANEFFSQSLQGWLDLSI
jgi:hypothetical protein